MEYEDFTLNLLTNPVDRAVGESEPQSENAREIGIRWQNKHDPRVGIEGWVELPAGIEGLSAHVLGHLYTPISAGAVQHLSEQLTSLLFPPVLLDWYSAAVEECRSRDTRLRLRIITDGERLARLPFEYVLNPLDGRPLLLDPFFSLVRGTPGRQASLNPVEERPLRILLAGASPRAENLAWIDIEAEMVLIRGALRNLVQQERVTVQELRYATPEQLKRLLLDGREPFDLVHLIAHAGEFEGEGNSFVLNGESDLPVYVPLTVVGQWLVHAGVRLVVIGGCDVASSLGPWLAKAGVPASVLMQGWVSDAQTTEFMHNLYGFLAEWLPLDAAVSLARRLQYERTQGAPDWGAPVLHVQSAGSQLFAQLERPFVSRLEVGPQRPQGPAEWSKIIARSESDEATARVLACQQFADFYDREISTQAELSQRLSGRASEAIEHLLHMAGSDPSEEVRDAARANLAVLRPVHLDLLFARFVEQLTSEDANERLCAEAVLKTHGQLDRALIATIRSRVHRGSLCFAHRRNLIEVRLESDYPGEIRLQCDFGVQFGDIQDRATADRQEIVLDGPRQQVGSLLYSVTPQEPKDFEVWVTLRTIRDSAPPVTVVHSIRCQLHNPYEFGTGLHEPAMFYGRQEELQEIVQSARQQNRVIIGERRIGKTSLLQAVARQLGAPLIPVMFGLRRKEEDLFRSVVIESYAAARLRVPKLRPAFVLDAPETAAYGFYKAKADMIAILEQLRQEYNSEAQLVLLIDEGDPLFYEFKEEMRTDLRHLMNDVRLSAFIACVRRPEKPDDASSLINIFLPIRLHPLTAEEARSLIRNPVTGLLEFDDEAVDFILNKTEGRPAFVQSICYYAVEAAYANGRTQIDLADVQAVYHRHLLIPDFLPLKEAWNRLSSQAQKQLLASINQKKVPDKALQELRGLSVIEEIDEAPHLPRVFADWLREGTRRSWLTHTS